MIRRVVTALLLVVLVGAGLAVAASPSVACAFGQDCDEGGSGGGGGDTGTTSSGNQVEQYTQGTNACSVYANGGGMGMYCVGLGDGVLKTLRERFGKQKLQTCRYSAIPPGIQVPFNAREGEGRFMLMSCLRNIDFDTYSGGQDRAIDLSIVFVPDGTDIEDRHNGITDFLWASFDRTTQLPVPFMRTRPNVIPLVGIPTFFTFRWLDPATNEVVAQGPFAGRANGGGYREIERQGVVMRAEATQVRIDPNQKDMKAVTCAADTPYVEGRPARDQPADACSITFRRSSASARRYATEPIPSSVDDAFYASVEVTWRITYGDGDTMRELGDGFTMRIKQVVPVQEVQAPNQPPAVIY